MMLGLRLRWILFSLFSLLLSLAEDDSRNVVVIVAYAAETKSKRTRITTPRFSKGRGAALSSSFSLFFLLSRALVPTSAFVVYSLQSNLCGFSSISFPLKRVFHTHTHRAQTTHNDDDGERKPRARAGTDGDNNSSNAIRNTNDSNTVALLKLYELNGKRRDESRGDPGPRGLHFRHRFLLREAEKPEEDAEQVGVSEVRSESEETLLVRGE
jgi:hypothetical protein